VRKIEIVEIPVVKDDITIGIFGVLPPMHLTRKDQEQITRPDLISLEIDLMDTGSFCKQKADIKDMAVGQKNGLRVLRHMFCERIGIKVGLRSDVFKIGNVIDRDSFMCHMSERPPEFLRVDKANTKY
jgi:hypothetical protein